MTGSPLLVLTTLASLDDARRLVRTLVDERLVACGTVLPGATSIYRWQGGIHDAAEVVVLLKTMSTRWESLRDAVRRHHPYDVPELLALPVSAGLDAYVDWVAEEVAP
ncbi:MAG TPA: divalent-cation tolerance protein CutA [Gemmatimonadales bacterium]|jgi:periplasmic divalent cation tolerance protein|nr:divalent-cation tolerance protein CutA [Gemmatimonadales bacterium]